MESPKAGGMIGLFCFVLAVLASPFKSKLRLEAENAVLRHQLIVLKRRLHGRVRLTNHDRWFLIELYTAQGTPNSVRSKRSPIGLEQRDRSAPLQRVRASAALSTRNGPLVQLFGLPSMMGRSGVTPATRPPTPVKSTRWTDR